MNSLKILVSFRHLLITMTTCCNVETADITIRFMEWTVIFCELAIARISSFTNQVLQKSNLHACIFVLKQIVKNNLILKKI